MYFRALPLAITAVSVMIAACHSRPDQAVTAADAMDIANKQLVQGDQPPLNLSRYRVSVRGHPDRWEVIHSSDGTGGPIVTEIDKRTGQVLGGRVSQ